MTEDSFFTGWEKVIKATPRSDTLDFRTTTQDRRGNARSSGYARRGANWYVESPGAVDMLLDKEQFDGMTWDPACGGGNIPKRFLARHLEVMGTDLIDRGYAGVQDFLDTSVKLWTGVAVNICTNPPFPLAQRFVEHAMKLVTGKIAIIQMLAFLEGQKRGEMFRATPPARVYVFSPRQSMPPGDVAVKAKGGSKAFQWLIWDMANPTKRGDTRMDWLP